MGKARLVNLDITEFKGTVTIPGDSDRHAVSIFVDIKKDAARVVFESPVGGANDWAGTDVVLQHRLKYKDLVFKTMNLPVEGLQLVWKMNFSLDDRIAAAIVLVRPNDLKIKGEFGFTLVGPGESSEGGENYLTRLESAAYAT
jgi:hypothetical protein